MSHLTSLRLSIVIFSLILGGSTASSENSQKNCSTLYLLNVVPYPDNGENAGWDRGLDLVPAGHLAAAQINNHSELLSGYKLELVDIDSESCGRSTITKGVVNLHTELVTPILNNISSCVVGIIGLYCSMVTNALAPIVSRPGVDYVKLAASTSPEHRYDPTFRDVFHTIASSSVFNEAVIMMMRTFNWRRIGLIHDALGFYFKTTSNEFARRAASLSDVELIVRAPIETSLQSIHGRFSIISDSITDTFNIINNQEVRISYWSVTVDESSFLLCEAFKRDYLWPGRVYILQERSVNDILKTETSCTREQMIQAMEGVFLLQYRIYVEKDVELYSGWTYEEFQQRYTDKLWEEAVNRTDKVEENIYANSLYDQVWAFALALNSSLLDISARNLSFNEYGIGNTKSITDIIEDELSKVDFQGVTGRIMFDRNRSIPSFVDIMQVKNGKEILVGIYNPFHKNITRQNFPDSIPDDTFQTVHILLPLWLGGCILVIQFMLLCLITTNTVLLLWWREESEIKASGPTLSIPIMIGCYLLCAAPIVLAVKEMVLIHNVTLLIFLCNLKLWSLSIGIDLIFATLSLRLLRLFHIFRSFHKTGKFWSDKYLFLYLFLICSVKAILLFLWTYLDTLRPKINRKYVPSATPPHYQVSIECNSQNQILWLLATYLYSGILIIFVLFMATQTRRIKKAYFKDTKKVNLFIFLVTIILATTLPLWVIFGAIRIEIGAHVCEWLAYFSVAVLCQLCLFSPKLLPLARKKTPLSLYRSTHSPSLLRNKGTLRFINSSCKSQY
jgi:gamma-aminobutyric acid type B receptor